MPRYMIERRSFPVWDFLVTAMGFFFIFALPFMIAYGVGWTMIEKYWWIAVICAALPAAWVAQWLVRSRAKKLAVQDIVTDEEGIASAFDTRPVVTTEATGKLVPLLSPSGLVSLRRLRSASLRLKARVFHHPGGGQ
jgi:hypothetical protein